MSQTVKKILFQVHTDMKNTATLQDIFLHTVHLRGKLEAAKTGDPSSAKLQAHTVHLKQSHFTGAGNKSLS